MAKLDPSDAELFPAPPPAAQPAHNWRSDSLNQLQTVPAPRHKEGAVRIRYHIFRVRTRKSQLEKRECAACRLAADADRVEVEFVDEVVHGGGGDQERKRSAADC